MVHPSPRDLPDSRIAFNSHGIVFDNSPWRPGKDMAISPEIPSEDNERRLKNNLATRIMSNGVEVVVKDHQSESRSPTNNFVKIRSDSTNLSPTTAQANKGKHNFGPGEQTKYMEIKTVNPTSHRDELSEQSSLVKLEKRIDNMHAADVDLSYDIIQPSEVNHPGAGCTTTSCPCSHTQTESIDRVKSKYTNSLKYNNEPTVIPFKRISLKSTKLGSTKYEELTQTRKPDIDKSSIYGPYKYETTKFPPSDKVVEKYTEVINDYSDEKDSDTVEESDLLTNEEAPSKVEKISQNLKPEKTKEKPPKPNKNKFVVADLLKLGSLGIKGLSQLAPVLEKMTGGFMKRQDMNKTTTTTTGRPGTDKITPYNLDKRVDSSENEKKPGNFPIYIPVDELETSESQNIYSNATLHQNLAWAAEQKHPKAHYGFSNLVHESPLVNGGIPISPGEIITTNSDVIVGKPAVGGPLTLAASGIKLHSSSKHTSYDSHVSSNEPFLINERLPRPDTHQHSFTPKNDDSYDLRPPELPNLRPRLPPKDVSRRPGTPPNIQKGNPGSNIHYSGSNKFPMNRIPPDDQSTLGATIHNTNSFIDNGRPAISDHIPSVSNNMENKPINHDTINQNNQDQKYHGHRNKEADLEVADSNPSSSEIINKRVRTEADYSISSQKYSESMNKPFLVDIQPSRVANILIPHGSSTALVFAGSSEPHKTGDYIDDPLPYPEPGYFGSFSIDAPQMTMVHNAAPSHSHKTSYNFNHRKPPQPNENQFYSSATNGPNHDYRLKWNKNKGTNVEFNRIPPPTSNQETHIQVGPNIATYNPDIINPSAHDFENYKNKVKEGGSRSPDGKKVIDKEYENHLAVPPPPPSTGHYHYDSTLGPDTYKNGRPYNQRPIFHSTPIQDMKVFLNIQHPVSKPHNTQNVESVKIPTKVTSEIYFAAAAPHDDKELTYTLRVPVSTAKTPLQKNQMSKDSSDKAQNNNDNFNIDVGNQQTASFQPYPPEHINTVTDHFTDHNLDNQRPNIFNENENVYSITLNAAANIGNPNKNSEKILGTSVEVPLGIPYINSTRLEDSATPIATNVAIKVDENPVSFQSFNLNHQNEPSIIYNQHGLAPEVIIGDNRWNYSPRLNETNANHSETGIYYNEITEKTITNPSQNVLQKAPNSYFHNSHANFPMIYDVTTKGSISDSGIKPVTEDVEDIIKIDQKRPSKLIPNIPINSHGWYSSNPMKNINKIKVDSTTRKIIPLSHSYDRDTIPEFGEKIPSVGVPPPGLWNQKKKPIIQEREKTNTHNNSATGRNPNDYVGRPSLTTQPYNPAYIPSNFGVSQQPAYPIPVRDDDYYETVKPHNSSEKVKPVYENSEEIYDGGSDEIVNDDEVSLESMKIPVISNMGENKISNTITTPVTLLQDEVVRNTEQFGFEKRPDTSSNSNFGSQTEKPFLESNFKQGPSQFSTQRPSYVSNSHMKPRPFEVNSHTPSFASSPNPHWQINHILENMTTELEENTNLVLNIGEEMTNTKTPVELSTKPSETKYTTQEGLKKKPSRPIFSLKRNKTQTQNESTNIITSTIHLTNRNPLTVINTTREESSSIQPNFTFGSTNLEGNQSMMDIINLSPPPPTLDYDFKPSSSYETIMGMSPPPARTPVVSRVPPIRTPAPPRVSPTRPPLPTRTPPPYRNKPVRTQPPKNQPTWSVPSRNSQKDQTQDDISTYRPTFDKVKNRPKYPSYNRDSLPSHLMPPPTITPSTFVPELSMSIQNDIVGSPASNIIFPSLTSSGWLTSSSVEFPQKPIPEYSPSSVQFSFSPSSSVNDSFIHETIIPPRPVYDKTPALLTDEHKVIPLQFNDANSESTTKQTSKSNSEIAGNSPDSIADESNISHEVDTSSESKKVVPLSNFTGTQTKKQDDRKFTLESRIKLPIKPTTAIRPTKTLSRSETLQPTRFIPPRKRISNVYSTPSRIPIVQRPTTIESSESPIEDEYIRPTEILKENMSPSSNDVMVKPLQDSSVFNTLSTGTSEMPLIITTHHAGNEIKISDEILPTKTEFKTTAFTLTKTLLEPPKTVSTTRFLTHTHTVTHTKTNLVSQSAGVTTQTLILTNTHTSTILDVVTEIHTQVQPTTIVETVTKHIPIVQPTPVLENPIQTTVPAIDDINISSEEDNYIINPGNETTDNIQKLDKEDEHDTFLIVMNKSQNGGSSQPVNTDIETPDYDGVTRNEEINNNGVSQVLFGEILLAGTPYLETTSVVKPTGTGYSKECQPDCKASRNERCQRIDGIMKCVCRPGFARMFPDRPCKPTYTYSVKLTLSRQGKERLQYHESLSNNATKEYHKLALATHEGINRMVMQSDLRDVFHGIHINGFHPVEVPPVNGEVDQYTGVANDFYVQLSDNAHETRLKEVIEKYLRNNNYSLGGTDVYASGELLDQLLVSDFDECHSVQFHDCSEHAQCFNLRGTYTCSCVEGFADMSVNSLYPGRICSAEQVGCERCNYHGACYTRDDKRVLCECFQWYAGSSCHINLKVILISLTTVGAALVLVVVVCGVLACSRRRPVPARAHPIVASCIQSMPSLHQGGAPSKHRGTHDRRALITERTDSGDASSVHNVSLPYMPAKKMSAASGKGVKRCSVPEPPTEKAPAPCVMIPRARLHQTRDGREGVAGSAGAGGGSRKPSAELSSEAKLISYLESGSNSNDEMMRRKHSQESSYSLSKERQSKHNAAGALVSAGFKVSTTVKPDDSVGADDASSINKADLLDRHYDLRKTYSNDNISEWTDAERRIGELTLSEARSVGGTLPASTGRAASSTRLTHQEANTMAERDLGSTFLLPHVHLYKPELGSDVSEFDSL